MTYIPNVRERKDQLSAMYGKDRDNAYFEGYLNADDRREMLGFDWAVEQLETALGNMEFDGEISKETSAEILEWMESSRNETVVSMLENMDDQEYERIKAEVDAEEEV